MADSEDKPVSSVFIATRLFPAAPVLSNAEQLKEQMKEMRPPTDPLAKHWGDNPPERIRDMRYTADAVGVTKELLDALVFCADHDPIAAMESLHTALARLGISMESQVQHLANATNGGRYEPVTGPDPRD